MSTIIFNLKMYKTTWIFLLIGIFAETFVKPVSGVRLTFSKQSVVKQPGKIVLTCGVNENDVGQIFVLQIKVLIGTIMAQVGKLDNVNGLTLTIPPSMTDRMIVAGSIDKVTPSMSQLTLTIDTEKVQCTDGTVYKCDMTYFTNSVDNPVSRQSSDNGTLAVFVNPEMLSLDAKHNGENIEAPTPEKKAIFKIGDHLELTCTANVGTIPTTSIQWRRTTEIGKDDFWNEYQPPQGTYTETDAVTDGNCGYTRTSTISYNMTAADANRQNNLAFECYLFVSTPPYSNFRTDNNPRFYIDVGSESSECKADSAGFNPEMLSMECIHNGETIEAATPSNKATFKIGDQLKLKCTANVGSIPSTSIQWRKTTEIGRDDLWNEYQPPQGTYTETDAVSDGNCGYNRTSTIFYSMTLADANRLNNLAFECYVFVSTPPYSNFTTTDNPRFYADVGSESSKCRTDSACSSSSSKVLIGLVVGEGVTGLCLIAAVAYLVAKIGGVGYKQDRQQVQRTEPERNQSTYTDLQSPRANMEMAYDVLENADRERNPGYVNVLG